MAMSKKNLLAVAVILTLLVSTLVGVQSVKAQFLGAVYINADGSVTGTNSIQRSGDLYILTGNISGGIAVQKSNITIDGAGYTLQGNGGTGIDLTNNVTQVPSAREIWNVTIKNLGIMNFNFSVQTNGGGNDTFYDDYIANTTNGIGGGIFFFGSSRSNITYCTISGTPAIAMELSSHNTVTENNLSGGILLQLGGDETVDRNYWSDYLTKYPNATEIDSSGIGNTPYVFNSYGPVVGTVQDNHPLLKPVAIPNFGTPSSSPSSSSSSLPSSSPQAWILTAIIIVTVVGLGLTVYFRKRRGRGS